MDKSFIVVVDAKTSHHLAIHYEHNHNSLSRNKSSLPIRIDWVGHLCRGRYT